MRGPDAFGEEMEFLRRLKAEDIEEIIAARAPGSGELAELAAFTGALRSSLAAQAPPPASASFVAQLAESARAGATLERPQSRDRLGSARGGARPRRRLGLVARVAVAVAMVPVLFAGLAFAGVSLPGPAGSVFESVGVDLPNQAADDDDTEGTAHDGDSAGSATGQENSAGKRGHGKKKSNPARDRGRANGTQGQGRALGKRGLAPGKALGLTKPNPGRGAERGRSGGSQGKGKSGAPPDPKGGGPGGGIGKGRSK